MSEYINREAAYKTLTKYYHHTTQTMHDALREALDRVPSAKVQPVRHGRWHRKEYSPYESRDVCSECWAIFDRPTDSRYWNYCPNCGVRMDKQEGSAEYDPDKFFGRKN